MKTVSDRRYTEACNPLGSYWSVFAHFDFRRDSWLNFDYLRLFVFVFVVFMFRVWTGLNHWLCPYFQKSTDSKMQGRRWPCDIRILFLFGLWAESCGSRVDMLPLKEKKKINYFQTGYFVKALISQSFIDKTLLSLTGLYMHKWMWHLRQRECHERFWMPVSPFLSNETTTFLNISRKWKPPNAIHCWCTKRQKTEKKKCLSSLISKTLL